MRSRKLTVVSTLCLLWSASAWAGSPPHAPHGEGASAAPTAAPSAANDAAKPAATPALAAPSGPDPEAALGWLKTGNMAFVKGTPAHPNSNAARVKEVAQGQKPFATVLSCSDSRVPVELLFDRGIGDLFVVRVAGNVADVDELGTIEYGVDHLGTPVLVVLGHTSCGAVTAVATNAKVHGHIPALVDNIAPAVELARKANPDADPKSIVPQAVQANVFQAMADVIVKSAEVRARLKDNKVKIVGAIYRLDDGQVEWLGSHPEQAALIEQGDRTPVATHDVGHGAAEGATPEAHDPTSPPAHGEQAHAAAGNPGPGAPWLFGMVAFLGALGGALSGRLSSRD